MEDRKDKYTLFNNWCQQQGVIMPKLKYPCYFENGLLGVGISEDILKNEVYIYIPQKMILTDKNTTEHEILSEIVKTN
jgi:hypothetical protein